jgi:flagellar basal-body rod modification protein FlgD
MQVTNNTAASQTSGAADPLAAATGTGLKVDELANKETFLQLLVAQIKNQDPLQPTDGIQFVSQLAQFSQLEQLIGIKGDLEALKPAAPDTTTLP